MNWTLIVTDPARKELRRLPKRDVQRILAALGRMRDDPFSGDIKRLHPEGWRRRVGNYRVFYDLAMDEHRIVVTAIERRTSTTY